jgi:hypothetical protein
VASTALVWPAVALAGALSAATPTSWVTTCASCVPDAVRPSGVLIASVTV